MLWGTGGGADPANDTGGTSGDQTAAGNFVVIVAGRRITPIYAGASTGYPGLWQINFVLPLDINLTCFATVQVSAGGEVGNLATIAIAAPGATACSDPDIPADVLVKLDTGGEITVGAFGVYRATNITVNATVQAATGFVGRYTAAAWLLTYSRPKFGLCGVYERTFPLGGLDPASPKVALDAGAMLPLSGPGLPGGAALARMNQPPMGSSYAYIPTNQFTAGLYTLTGTGGTEVGPFTVSTNYPASFGVTNFDSVTAIDRTKPLALSWTGSGFSNVIFVIGTAERIGSNQHLVTIECGPIQASLGTYSVPAEALAYLSAVNANVSVQAVNSTSFMVPLVGGGQTDLGAFEAHLGTEKTVPVR